ncbi:hypothetical protein WJX72_009432 [[Myrmecia] bisecta]|uniref:HhH-GPD domain-containing protein n=1 Tax=[Myrmecia] bisecta TaxID=41462 RepID=A0AAW1PTP8_9CHLO
MGIGPKAAAYICLFALDKTEAIPVDTHVWQLISPFKAVWGQQIIQALGPIRSPLGQALTDGVAGGRNWCQHVWGIRL